MPQPDSVGRFRENLFAFARARGEPWDLARGATLQRPHARDTPLFLITAGAAHAYVDAAGGRQTLRLGYPGELLAALPGLLRGLPSGTGIEAITRCRGYTLRAADVRAEVERDDATRAAYTEMLEGFVCGLVTRELDLLDPSPERRYAAMVARSPQVLRHVPLRYVASYLRMTPETLSRIRRRKP